MELATKIGALIDRWMVSLFILTLIAIFIHFLGFIKSGRFHKRFLSGQKDKYGNSYRFSEK